MRLVLLEAAADEVWNRLWRRLERLVEPLIERVFFADVLLPRLEHTGVLGWQHAAMEQA